MLLIMFLNALAANLGMQIVKDENAVVKQSIILLPIPLQWFYHIYYGDQKDQFTVIKMIGQILMTTSIILYITFDRQSVLEEKANKEAAALATNEARYSGRAATASHRETTELSKRSYRREMGLPSLSADEEALNLIKKA